jgi:NAD(P)-dependent dehydrogenase (short-subunit alcohol dehydrogenase family)
MSPLDGKVAIVTGASRGIGYAIALRLASDGANIVLCARDRALLDQASREVENTGSAACVVAQDLRLPDAGERVIDAAAARFGAIDILINNAGATKRGEFELLTEDDWTDGFALKLFGAVRMARAAWPYLRQRAGSLVNIAGSGGRTPGPQFAIGGAVNAALLSFTKALADIGLRDGVQVNAVNPGPVRTARFETRLAQTAAQHGVGMAEALGIFIQEEKVTKLGEPEDIAALVSFILSPNGRLLHGSLVDADGGLTKTI